MNRTNYLLMTAAKNEEDYIQATINSVSSQNIKPVMWIIVSDGSTDKTDDIIKKNAAKYNFIKYVRNDNNEDRNFASKVHALNIAKSNIENVEYDYIGILDADATFKPHYYKRLLEEFDNNPQLGLAGGFFFEKYKGKEIKVVQSNDSVRGAVQFFRKKCFDDIGDLVPLENGGEDIITEVTARMKGWKVESFDNLQVVNLRLSGLGRWGIYETKFREGMLAHSIGYHPLFQILKSIYRIKERPFLIAGVLHLLGYFWAVISRNKVKVTNEFKSYLREEQIFKLKNLLSF